MRQVEALRDENQVRARARRLCLAMALLCVTSPVMAQVVVKVNCNSGGSVNDALTTPGEELTIRIRGICAEDIQVSRDNVTFLGRDPLTDGFTAGPDADAEAPGFGTVIVRGGARDLHFERLGFIDGARNGLTVNEAPDVTVINCRFENNPNVGIAATDALVAIEDTQFIGNESDVGAFQGSTVVCTNCETQDSNLTIFAANGGVLTITGSTLRGAWGPLASVAGSFATVSNTTVETSFRGLYADFGGSLFVAGGQIDGSIWALDGALVEFNGLTQVANPQGVNVIDMASNVRTWASTVLLGDTFLSAFSNLVMADGSTHDGSVTCDSGSDTWCEDPGLILGGAVACAACQTEGAPISSKRFQASRLVALRPTLPVP